MKAKYCSFTVINRSAVDLDIDLEPYSFGHELPAGCQSVLSFPIRYGGFLGIDFSIDGLQIWGTPDREDILKVYKISEDNHSAPCVITNTGSEKYSFELRNRDAFNADIIGEDKSTLRSLQRNEKVELISGLDPFSGVFYVECIERGQFRFCGKTNDVNFVS